MTYITFKCVRFPCVSDSKESVRNAGDPDLIPEFGGFPGEGLPPEGRHKSRPT